MEMYVGDGESGAIRWYKQMRRVETDKDMNEFDKWVTLTRAGWIDDEDDH